MKPKDQNYSKSRRLKNQIKAQAEELVIREIIYS